MAFIIHRQPSSISPVFNHLTYEVEETTYISYPDFKYIFDLYINGTLVNTSKLYPISTTNRCIYDPSKIIQDYLSYQYNSTNTAGVISTTNEIVQYWVIFKREYYLNNVLTTSTVMMITNMKKAYNGAASYIEGADLTTYMAKYEPAADGLTEYLNLLETGSSSGIKIPILETEFRNVSMKWKTTAGGYVCNRMIVTTNSNKIFIKNISITGSSIYYDIVHYGIGIPQLNLTTWTSTTIPSGLSSNITSSEDSWYKVDFVYFNGVTNASVYKPLYFKIECPSQRNNKMTLCYQAAGGGFGYVPVYARNDKNYTTAKQTYKSKVVYTYTSKDREHKVYNNQAQRGIVCNTDWLLTQNQINEVMELITSPTIYLVIDGTTSIPVTIEDSTYNHYTKSFDKLVQYTFNLKYAYDEILIKG